MLAYTYISPGKFELIDKPKPELQSPRDAIVRITLGSICTSDLHIKHGSVPRAVPGITVGHEMVGVVEEVGSEVQNVKPGDRVTVNVETFCGECFFCKNGFVNNCTDPMAAGRSAVASMAGSWSMCVNTIRAWKLFHQRIASPRCAKNAIVTVVALYDKPQTLPLPDMYGKNLTFKTGSVDGCDCAEILSLIEVGKIDTTPLITHRYKLADIAEAYHLFENKLDGVIKVAVEP